MLGYAKYIAKGREMAKKIFILDTNVLIHDPESIFSFEEHIVGIPLVVLEEIDRFKSDASQRGRNARQVIRHLDLLRGKGNLADGIHLDNGGILQVLLEPKDTRCHTDLDPNLVDNRILLIAFCLSQEGYAVLFISKDLNARVKADILGIEALDYIKDSGSADNIYKGWFRLQVPAVQLKKTLPDELVELAVENALSPNEFILVESRNNPYNNIVYRYLGGGKFKHVTNPVLKWPLEPRNPQQLMALDLLFDNNVQLVTLFGPAGTGKTFLALLAALHKVLVEHEFEKILVTRPVIPLGPDIGFLPGDVHEKLHSWMQPIYDNMDFIAHSANAARQMAVYKDDEHQGKGGKFKHKKHFKERGIPSLDELIKEGKISLEAITYMRGRSIPYQFILIDEVQNLTPHEVKTLISRVGEGSKIVLAGDPYQIDAPYLDFYSNGLVVASTRFKGQQLFGSVFLESSERSELSKLAGELL